MFGSERELVEKLVLDLQERYNTNYIVRELRGGNNIADIVYTTDIERNNVVFDEYFNAYYYFSEIYNKKKIPMKNVEISNNEANKKFFNFLRDLEELGYIRIEDSCITSIKKVDAVCKNIIAIEAKLTDWKAGMEQAIRYKQYANEVYVAISSENAKNVDRELLKKENIGLMCVSSGKLKVSIKAKKEKVENLDIQYFMADRFLQRLNLSNN